MYISQDWTTQERLTLIIIYTRMIRRFTENGNTLRILSANEKIKFLAGESAAFLEANRHEFAEALVM